MKKPWKKSCKVCKYLHPNLKGAKYFKCYHDDCPAKKRDEESGKVPGGGFRRLAAKGEIEQLRQALKEMDTIRTYWKKAYIEECEKQEEWVEEHLQLVKRLLMVSSKEEGSLESFLFKLYNKFEQLEKQVKGFRDMSSVDLYRYTRKVK